MKIRVFGFAWELKPLVHGVSAADAFDVLAKSPQGMVFQNYLAAATKSGEWWCGVVLKGRDSREITKTRNENGVLVFCAERLAEGETHAEANFFIAHESNGNGLYCHHHLAATMRNDFAWIVGKNYQAALKLKRQEVEVTLGKYSQEAKRKKKHLKGLLFLNQILKPGTFKQYVETLKRISVFEAGIVSFETNSKLFQPLERHAKKRRVRLILDPTAPTSEITASICGMLEAKEIESGHVEGKDSLGVQQSYHFFKDPSIFAEWDFDDTIQSVVVRFDDISGSITSAEPIKRLLALTKDDSVLTELGL